MIGCTESPSLAQGGENSVWSSMGLPDRPTLGQIERALNGPIPPYRNSTRNTIYVKNIHEKIPDDLPTKLAASSPALLLLPIAADLGLTTKLLSEARLTLSVARSGYASLSEATSYGITYNYNQAMVTTMNVTMQTGKAYVYGSAASAFTGYYNPSIGDAGLGTPGDFLWWASQGASLNNALDHIDHWFGGDE